jgi:hypothetical protein
MRSRRRPATRRPAPASDAPPAAAADVPAEPVDKDAEILSVFFAKAYDLGIYEPAAMA